MPSRHTARALRSLCLATLIAPLLATIPAAHAMTDWLDPYRTTIAGKTTPGAFQWQTELDRALENAEQAAADPLLPRASSMARQTARTGTSHGSNTNRPQPKATARHNTFSA